MLCRLLGAYSTGHDLVILIRRAGQRPSAIGDHVLKETRGPLVAIASRVVFRLGVQTNMVSLSFQSSFTGCQIAVVLKRCVRKTSATISKEIRLNDLDDLGHGLMESATQDNKENSKKEKITTEQIVRVSPCQITVNEWLLQCS